MKNIAQVICNETGAEYNKTLDDIVWLALEGATNFMVRRCDGMKLVTKGRGNEWWALEYGCRSFKLVRSSGLLELEEIKGHFAEIFCARPGWRKLIIHLRNIGSIH